MDENEAETESRLNCWRRRAPIQSAHWSKIDLLTFSQAVLLYYEIEPSILSEDVRFMERFIQECDVDRIHELMISSMRAGSLYFRRRNHVSTASFCKWLKEKGLHPLKALTHTLPEDSENHFSVSENNKDESSVNSNATTKPLRPSQEDKIRCHTIAQLRWKENPKLSITKMAKTPEMQMIGNDKLYGLATIKKWIKECDP
jgi:hypothetical protein